MIELTKEERIRARRKHEFQKAHNSFQSKLTKVERTEELARLTDAQRKVFRKVRKKIGRHDWRRMSWADRRKAINAFLAANPK